MKLLIDKEWFAKRAAAERESGGGMSMLQEPMPKTRAPWWRRIPCFFGRHSDYTTRQRPSGFAIQHLMFPVHEIEADCTCRRCFRMVVKGGFVPNSLTRHVYPKDYNNDEHGWPVNSEGQRIPYRRSGGTDG